MEYFVHDNGFLFTGRTLSYRRQLCQDRRYGWIMAGMIVGILFAVFARISMNLDLSQVKDHANKYTTGTVVEVSQITTGKQALLLKNEVLEGKILLYTTNDKK